jgi:hypothetical protein
MADEVFPEQLMAAAGLRAAAGLDYRQVQYARGVADAVEWMLWGRDKPAVDHRLRVIWDAARADVHTVTVKDVTVPSHRERDERWT